MSLRYWIDLRTAVKGGVTFGRDRSTDGGRTCPFAGATMYLRHRDVHDMLEASVREEGYSRTTNELGIHQLNDELFPPTGLIALSSPRHDEIRPWLDALCDGALRPWSEDELAADAADLVSERQEMAVRSVATRWVAKWLFRILAALDPSETELDDFVRWQGTALKVGVLPRITHFLQRSSIRWAHGWRTDVVTRMTEALRPLDGPGDREDREELARAVVDTLTFAGGLSVPYWINQTTAVLWSPDDYDIPSPMDDESLTGLLFEVLR